MKKFLICLIISFIVAIGGVGAYVVVNATPGDALILADYFEISYEGYNNTGKVDIVRKDDMLFDEVDIIRLEQKESMFRNQDVTQDEYLRFAAGIEALAEPNDHLKNGDQYIIRYIYDKELAKKLHISVDDAEKLYTVEGLSDAQALGVDDLFKDLTVVFNGISPDVTMTIVNNSTNPLIKSLDFKPVEYKEKYSAGEVVRIRCFFEDNKRLHDNYYINALSAECVKDYVVSGTDAYVSSLAELPTEVISEAIEAGKKAFVDANEYGVRIFCEAHLVPVYINQQATFRYLSPSLCAAYFKTVNPSEAGKLGNAYNVLDLVYSVKITQADGVTCDCEAVVRYTDIVRKADGSLEYDFSNPSIMSASYNNSSIHKNVVTSYEGKYNIEKLDIRQY